MPLATVVIPTLLHQPALVKECLASLAAQAEQDFVTFVVVNNSQPEQLEEFQKTLIDLPQNMHWLPQQKNLGFAGAVNIGIAQATTKYLVMLNDDTQAQENWLAELIKTQEQTGAEMIASTIYQHGTEKIDSQGFSFAWRGKAEAINDAPLSFKNERDYWLKNENRQLLPVAAADDEYWQEPFGADAAACLYTAKLIAEVGMFNEKFFAYLEDVDLALRARKAGFKCVLAEKAVVYHHKHATSARQRGFKSRQDLKNWWRIVVSNYPRQAWKKYGLTILIERLRNISGRILG